VLTDALSSGATFVSARVNKGTVTAPPNGETGTVTWTLGDMLDQANEVAEIKVPVTREGQDDDHQQCRGHGRGRRS